MNNMLNIRVSQRLRIATILAATVWLPAAAFAQSAPAPARPAPVAKKPVIAAQSPAPAAPTPIRQGAAQGTARVSVSDDVVARVGDANVSADEIRAYLSALGGREQAALAKDPALLSQAVKMLLANRLVLQEVVAKKWDQQPNVVAQLDRVRENALIELYLQSVTTPPAAFPTDEDVQKVYDANRASLIVPRQYELAQIFVAAAKDDKVADDKAKKKLDDIQKKLKAPGADFAAIGGSDSDTPGSGELGWLSEAQIVPEIRNQLAGLAKGAVSEPVRLDDGWHIVKLLDTKASYTRTLPEVRDQLVQQMRSERATALRRAYLAELLKQHPPVVNEFALSNLLDSSRK